MQSVLKIEVIFPKDFSEVVGFNKGEVLSREAKKLMVFELFREGKISSGRAAKLLEINRLTFIELLAERGIPYLNYTREELKDEFSNVEKLLRKL